ncbi:MAG: c-type cytochrome domain-containing protein [Cyclobacteriaceae bacterium]
MDFITAFFGRFHPLLVHLPIGILFLAFLFECLSLKRNHSGLKKAVQPALFWGSLFAIAAATSGYFLRQEGGYEEDLANLHQNFGIATAFFSLVLYVLRRKLKFWIIDPVKRKQVRVLIFIPVILLLSLTGHFGGSLTHGEDYLSAVISFEVREPIDPAVRIQAIANIQEAVLYDDVIQPILEARCYDCHSSTKQKGELRLDKEEFIIKGGKNGDVIRDGPADSSALYSRLLLPLEDEHHMPPNEKPQLSSSEIALIQYWIEEKAHFDKPVSQFRSDEKITAIIQSLQEAPRQSWVPKEDVSEAKEKTLRNLNDLKITPMPLAAGNNYLMVTFSGLPEITDEQTKSLQEINQQLVWLNLSQTRISDQQLAEISKLTNLRVLYLNNTGITDSGLSQLEQLSNLRLLSLVGTGITDESIPTFLKLKTLTNLFLYQSSVTDSGIKRIMEGLEEIKVDTGNYVLKPLATDTIVYKKISQ